jgi:hypothetical protein
MRRSPLMSPAACLDALWIVAGAITGPLFGYLCHRWRVARSWVAAALVTVALCFEPLARSARESLSRPPFVWGAEVAIGIGAGPAFALLIARRGRSAPPLEHAA